LFSNISTGVMDFFYEPAKGVIESPEAFAKGLAKGTSSLVKNTVYATFSSVSQVVGAIGKGVAKLSCDDEYVRRRQANQRKKPKHALDGAAQGAIALGRGFFDGISGLVLKPVEGVRREGAAGLFKGIGQGVIGVAVKPIAGIFEATSKTAEGFKNTAVMFDEDRNFYRIRGAPRQFTKEKQLLEFNPVECEGIVLISQSKALHGDTHLLHMQLAPIKKDIPVALLTTKHVSVMLVTRIKYEFNVQTVVPLERIVSLVIDENNDCVIVVHTVEEKKPLMLCMQTSEDSHLFYDALESAWKKLKDEQEAEAKKKEKVEVNGEVEAKEEKVEEKKEEEEKVKEEPK